MSRDFILVFSGGLVSLMTTLVVLFVMDYYYRRLDRERGTTPSQPDTKPAVRPVVTVTKPVDAPRPVASSQPTQVETPKLVVVPQPTRVESPKPVAPKPVESKPLPTYKPSTDSLLPPQLRKPATPDQPVAPPKPAPQVTVIPSAKQQAAEAESKLQASPSPEIQAKPEPKPQAQEKELPKEESKNEPPTDSLLPPERMKP